MQTPFWSTPLLALLSFALTGGAIAVARRRRWLAHPEERSSHTTPTPQVGGVGVCIALLCALIIAGRAGFPWSLTVAVGFGFGLGWWDDLRAIGPWHKLVGEVVLAALVVWAFWDLGGSILLRNALRHPESQALMPIAIICPFLVFVWALFFVNAFNFMDGVNGQSGVFAILALFWFFLLDTDAVCGQVNREGTLTVYDPLLDLQALPIPGPQWWVEVFLFGGLLGFLPWNFPRARTFLGDCGSLTVGAVLALLCALLLVTGGLSSFIPGLIVLSPYSYDVLFTLIRRWRRGERVWTAHRSHLYQRLLIATGWSHARLLAFHLPYWTAAGLLAVELQMYMTSHAETGWPEDGWFPVALLSVALALAVLLAGYTKLVWQAEERRVVARAACPQRPSIPREDQP